MKWICSGFHTEGCVGRRNSPPPLSHNFPPPEILKLSIVIVLAIYVTGHKYVSYSLEILSQIASEAIWEENFPGRACSQTLLVGTHTFCTLLSPLPSCFPLPPPPPHLKILYETLLLASASEGRDIHVPEHVTSFVCALSTVTSFVTVLTRTQRKVSHFHWTLLSPLPFCSPFPLPPFQNPAWNPAASICKWR